MKQVVRRSKILFCLVPGSFEGGAKAAQKGRAAAAGCLALLLSCSLVAEGDLYAGCARDWTLTFCGSPSPEASSYSTSLKPRR